MPTPDSLPIATPFSSFRNSLLGRRLWLGWGAYALFVGTILLANWLLTPGQHIRANRLGYDFLPFYTAGQLVSSGRYQQLYDLDAIRAREHAIAAASGLELGNAVGPFWNPPFYALVFVPFAGLAFQAAFVWWSAVNLACVGLTLAILWRIDQPANRALMPTVVATSVPFILAFTHGQNSGMSLLILTITCALWRKRCAWRAGLAVGLLAYKPQLAALAALILSVDLGWRALAGMCVTGSILVALTLIVLPGSSEAYANSLPRILHFMQVENPYIWERHVTLTAFWRLLLQGWQVGEATMLVRGLAAGCSAGIVLLITTAAFRSRARRPHLIEGTDFGSRVDLARRDLLIAATVVAMPLVMPFFFDYDLLLLAIPAALASAHCPSAGERRAPHRWVVGAGCVLYGWLVLNVDIAMLTRVNLAVPILTTLVVGLIAVRRSMESATKRDQIVSPAGALRRAA